MGSGWLESRLRQGGLSLGTERSLIQRSWGGGGRASVVLQAKAKSFCGLDTSDNLHPQAIEARGWGAQELWVPLQSDIL